MKVSLPLPPTADTFTWLLQLAPGVDEADFTWYVDGSLFDEHKRVMRRTGFGVAAVNSAGTLFAYGRGGSPAWVHDAAGAELLAVYFVLSHLVEVPHVVTDCKGVLDGLQCKP